MKRLLWLVPPSEPWLASNLAPRLESGLRSSGFLLSAPVPPKEPGLASLLIHYARLLRYQGDIVHAFDRLSAVAGLAFRRAKERVVADGGIIRLSSRNWEIPKLKTIYWGSEGDLPWPVCQKQIRSFPMGNIIGFDLGKTNPKVAESVVWAFEISRQVASMLKLALGEGIHADQLRKFAKAVGARQAIGDHSCESVLTCHRLRGLLLANPSRRLIDLAARALDCGSRVAWVQEKNDPVDSLPSTDEPVDWNDRPGLARLFLSWAESKSYESKKDGNCSELGDLVRGLSMVYQDSAR